MKDKSNLLDATVPITLDGREFQLRYRALAFIAYAEALKRDLLQDIGEIGKEFTAIGRMAVSAQAEGGEAEIVPVNLAPAFMRIRDLLWAGLIDVQPEMTRDAVARLFGFSDLNEVATTIMAAMRLTLPETKANGAPAGLRPTIAPRRGKRTQ
jgi:hypothetical protein